MGIGARLVRGLKAPAITAALSAVPAVSPAALAGAVTTTRNLASPWSTGQLATLALADVLGVDPSLLPLTREEGMSVPAAARARNLLCSTVAGINLAQYKGRRRFRDTWEPTPGPDQPAWIDRTDSALPDYQRMTHTVDDLYWTGFSLWSLTPGSVGMVDGHADRVERSRWTFAKDGRVLIDGKLPAAAGHPNVVLICGPHEGLLVFAARTLRHASRLLHAAETASRNPSAYLELHQTAGEPLDKDERRELISEWAQARNGENGGVAYTNASLELKEHGTFDAHLLVDGRQAAAVDVARAASVPAAAIDAVQKGGSLTYQTVRDNARNLIDTGAGAYLGAISGSLSHPAMTQAGHFVMFELEAWLNENNPAPLATDAARPAGPVDQAPDDDQEPPA